LWTSLDRKEPIRRQFLRFLQSAAFRIKLFRRASSSVNVVPVLDALLSDE
jgi:hypothetical protein